MNPFSWEIGLFPLGVTLILGGTTLYKFKKSQTKSLSFPVVLCHSTLLCLWGVYCFSSLSNFWGWTLFSLACFISLAYSKSQEMLPVDRRAVLITGGDSGIGHALSKYLDELGFTVFVGVLNEKGPGAEALKKYGSKRISVFQMDITKPAQIKEVKAQIEEKVKHTGLWAIVNNAAILGIAGDIELIPMNDFRECMNVNFFGPLQVIKTFLPLLRKSRGRIINISSLAATVPMSLLASYCSSKAALNQFTSIMRLELEKWGIKVSLIQSSGFKTSIGGTIEKWEKQEKEVLENISPDVLEDYGQDYLRSSTWPFLQSFNNANPDFSPLFADVLHSILCKNPSAFYTAGIVSFLLICMFSCFPLSILDISKKISPKGSLPKALT